MQGRNGHLPDEPKFLEFIAYWYLIPVLILCLFDIESRQHG